MIKFSTFPYLAIGVLCVGALEVSPVHAAEMDLAGAILTMPTAIDTRKISVADAGKMRKAAGNAGWGIITNKGCFAMVDYLKPLGEFWDPFHFVVSVETFMNVGTYSKYGSEFVFVETGAKGRLGMLFTQDVKACHGLSDALAEQLR